MREPVVEDLKFISISLFIRMAGELRKIWSLEGDQLNVWRKAQVQIPDGYHQHVSSSCIYFTTLED